MHKWSSCPHSLSPGCLRCSGSSPRCPVATCCFRNVSLVNRDGVIMYPSRFTRYISPVLPRPVRSVVIASRSFIRMLVIMTPTTPLFSITGVESSITGFPLFLHAQISPAQVRLLPFRNISSELLSLPTTASLVAATTTPSLSRSEIVWVISSVAARACSLAVVLSYCAA